ncbi:hypothetical protein FQN60_005598 [Etheostoma spectabile]|uniref:Uncharacterized protein n=1 Tax=Etheostoma spectabile TaxID=54343 RepID=A0A5J5CGD9_9PERO|nr:hypothetical protein FQN60_005598 [Etheostoma spectabile]
MNLLTPKLDLRDGDICDVRRGTEGKGGRKVEKKIEKKSCCEQRGGEKRKGWRRRRKEDGGSAFAVRNADPFPRWPLWTISLPTASPKNHNVPRLSLFPTLRFAGLATRTHYNQQDYDAGPGSCLERSIHPGRGLFGMAHSLRMGVISSALPGLSGGRARHRCKEPTGGRRGWWNRERGFRAGEGRGD